MTIDLKASSQLFGSYFHQDWVEEFDTDTAAVEAMMDSEPREALAAASREIHSLLLSDLGDAELGSIMLDDVGCYFDPASKEQTYREWLGDVLAQLKTKA
jgi:hypothetical protein